MVLTATAHPSVTWAGSMTPPCGFCAGDRISDGSYHLHSRFDRAANFTGVSGLVCLVDPSIGSGPNTITLDASLRNAPDSLSMRFPLLTLGVVSIDVSTFTTYDSRIMPPTQDKSRVRSNIACLPQSLARHAPRPSLPHHLACTRDVHSRVRRSARETYLSAAFNRIATGIRLLSEDRLVEGLNLIAGCGPGLTPSGDDFIAGWLTGLHVARLWFDHDESDRIRRIRKTVTSGNPIVESQLRFAAEGRVWEPMKVLLMSIDTGDEAMIDRSARRMCSQGASSGADFLAGFLFTFDQEFFSCH